MTDLQIIKELERELDVELTKTEELKFVGDYYILNDKKKIIGISFDQLTIEQLRSLKPYLNKLEQIKSLSIFSGQINDLTFLDSLPNLEHLRVDESLIEDLLPVLKLKNLKSLIVQDNRIRDISCLVNLKNVETLHFRNNQITDISCLKEMPQLLELGLGGNNIADISPLKYLKNIKNLFIWEVGISDISAISELYNIEILYLNGNKIKDLSPLRKLKNLRQLYLHENPFQHLPSWITEFDMDIKWYPGDNEDDSLKSIYFFENPLRTPPIEIVKDGKQAIQRYFEKINAEGFDYIYEAKVTLVGDGSAGKTSLQVRLMNPKGALPKKDSRTRGIKIHDWKFKRIKGHDHVAHLWDFGGQDVYYPVHRFFLTENSIFILLASSRQANHNFEYWIPTIYQFGGHSPIIIGQTCHDGNKSTWNDIGFYVGSQNFNIVKTQALPYYEINLPNRNEGLAKIKKTITDQIVTLPHYGKGVPTSWIPIRTKIAEKSKKTACIPFETFKEICRSSNAAAFKDTIDIVDCARFLHSIGVVLWYNENPELRNWVVLQPEWAMNAVYKIIDDKTIQKRRGNILAKDFLRLWKESCYEDMHVILKKMLEVFKIAFPKKHKNDDYIIPARLLSMPTESKWLENEPYLRLEYNFEFMPKGIINQLSAELSRYIVDDDQVWNNAVNLQKEYADCQIEEEFYNRKIKIKAKGKDARGLIILVTHTLHEIADGYKGVKPEIIVPCNCTKCKASSKPTLFSHDDLLRWAKEEEHAQVYCNEGKQMLPIETLLFNVGLSAKGSEKITESNNQLKKSKRVFVSYSKYDEDYLQDFQDHLVTLKDDERLITFDCREIELGKEWDTEIKKQIDECDIMVCLVSVKFLNTDYIKKIEIPKAIKQNKIIIPIIIKPCDWETSALGKYQAAQRGKVVSLNNNQKLLGNIKSYDEVEKAAFWTGIIKEFRKKLFS